MTQIPTKSFHFPRFRVLDLPSLMKTKLSLILTVVFSTLLFNASILAHDATAEMSAAATDFLASLNPEQQAKVQFDFVTPERANWHFIPRERKGLAIKEMNQEQRLLAQAFLATGLSHRGYTKAVSIMSLEAILAELEKDKVGTPVRDPEKYFFSIFGKPGRKEPWAWRFEGHHLSLNFTAVGDAAPAMTPSFFGTNPGEVRTGARTGARVLANEEEFGRSLIKMLNETQRQEAIILAVAPKDITTMPGRNSSQKEGLPQAKLTADQNVVLIKLIKEYLFRCRPDVAAEDWAKIEKAGLDKISFAWAGGIERGQPHYYRVQGEHFILEYDNTQNEANHVHSVWRDFDHDFGHDLLGTHYQEAHP